MPQAVTVRQKADTVRDLLEKFKPQLRLALPRHISADRMARVALTTCAKNPALLNCTPASLIGAVLTASQLGLEVDDTRGLAYLVPYGDKCTLIPGYRGLMELARRSGEISSIMAQGVYEKDDFDYSFGTEQYLRHRPSKDKDRGNLEYFYAVAHLKDGGVVFDVWSAEKVAAHREQYSKKRRGGSIEMDDVTYGRKTMVRMLAPYLPSSPELQRAVGLDEQAETGQPQDLDAVFSVEVEPSSDDKPAADKKLEAISGGKDEAAKEE